MPRFGLARGRYRTTTAAIATQCENLSGNRCLAAARGELDGVRNQHPFDKLPRRCVAYVPLPDDPDQRPGFERWRGLANYETNEETA